MTHTFILKLDITVHPMWVTKNTMVGQEEVLLTQNLLLEVGLMDIGTQILDMVLLTPKITKLNKVLMLYLEIS